MVSVSLLIRAAAAAMLSTTAYAADMPRAAARPVDLSTDRWSQQPTSAWYLRGDIGIAITNEVDFEFLQNPLNSSNFSHPTFFDGRHRLSSAPASATSSTTGYASTSPANIAARRAVNFFSYNQAAPGGGIGTYGDQYQGFLQSVVFLGNAYVDLGTWDCLTPFVGVGIGGAWNTFADLTDTSMPASGGRKRHRPQQQPVEFCLGACTPALPIT